MVRCGIAVYGLDPFGEAPGARGLEPALSLESYVAAVKRFDPGESAGYGRSWSASEPTWVGVLPIGYGDGWRRALSNNCDVLVGGRRRPLVGTVSMDNVTVDLGPDDRRRAGRAGGPDRRAGRRADPLRGGRAAPRHDQLRDHLRPDSRACGGCTSDEVGARPSRRCAKRSRRRARPGSSAARCATRCSSGRSRDVDLAVDGDPEAAARERRAGARRAGLPAVGGVRRLARAVAADAGFFCRRRPACRARRSRTTWAGATSRVNAMAVPVAGRRADRPARRAPATSRRGRLRVLGAEAYEADPLRPLRLARLAAELGFAPDAETERLTRDGRRRARPRPRRSASGPSCAGWSCPTARSTALGLADRLGLTRGGAAGARGAARRRAEPVPPPRRLRAHDGGAGAADRAREPPRRGVRRARRRDVAAVLDEPLADELTRGQALRFGALLHDVAKPRHARRAARRTGHVHRARRARATRWSATICRRLRTSERLRGVRGRADPPPPGARLPGPQPAALAARRLPLPQAHEPGRGRGHGALLRRPAGHPRQERRARRSPRTWSSPAS